MDSKFFTSFNVHLREMFNNYVEKVAEKFRASIVEEFYTTKTIHWQLEEFDDKIQEKENAGGLELLQHIYNNLKQRLLRKIRSKFFNIFLVPFLNADLWSDIQGEIMKMEQVQLDEIFEREAIEEGVDRLLAEAEKRVESCINAEKELKQILPRLSF